MYKDTIYEVKKSDSLFSFCEKITAGVKLMKNETNFHIRNVMTGIKKDNPTQNEKAVLEKVFSNLEPINRNCLKAYEKRIAKIKASDLSEEEKQQKIKKTKLKQFSQPTADKWFLGYEFLDALFKITKNENYKALPAHTAQNAIKECCKSWTGYFEALKSYKANPSVFTGKPRLPGYKKTDHATAIISKQQAYIEDGMLHLPEKHVLDISGHVPEGALVEVRIQPYYNGYRLHVITETEDVVEPSVNEGLMFIDPGLRNFLAITDNTGGSPVLVKGGFLKSRNRYFNKIRAARVSALTKDKGSKHKETKALKNLSAKRDRFLRDCFYKLSHRVARLAIQRSCGKIIIGHNVLQKQEVNIGHVNNQNFVSIPHAEFIRILKVVAAGYGIEVIEQEESYTSKASFLDGDNIPVYGDNKKHKFSGVRNKGRYTAKDGTVLNADINGSLNIGRKYKKDAFDGIQDFAYLKDVEVINYKDIYK